MIMKMIESGFQSILGMMLVACSMVAPFELIAKHVQHREYVYNPYGSLELWDTLQPYFLPENHPIKAKLDKLFKRERLILSKETFEAAGFNKIKMREPTNIIIGKHPSLKGYILKVYLDSQPAVVEWANWMDRITGAEGIRSCIKRHSYQKHFKVPHKWIYPLPASPSPPDDPLYNRKNFLLVVEDMRILSYTENKEAYRKKMTPELLNALYTILNEEGLLDSVYIDNIPFTEDGRIAFIDTEHHHKGPIRYEKLTGFFSPAMQQHWQRLIESGGP